MKEPDLLFPPGSPSGFTPTGLAGFSNLQPAAVVRELLQNSLDAASDAKESKAVVLFRLSRTKTEEVPGYEQYVQAFEKAVAGQETHSSLPDHAQEVVTTIYDCLTVQTCDVLSVLDNGAGLDQRSMTALLSDGMSAKGREATGSYGNGHMVTIPASDLRYVLYGGVSSDDDSIGAGHAILASHAANGAQHPNGADGFLVCGLESGINGEHFEYAKGDAVPRLIADGIDYIRNHWGHGAAVIIPWFNSFREDTRSLHEMVFKAAACNFFAAIEDETLEVMVEDRRDQDKPLCNKLTRKSLPEVLGQHQSERRRESFLRGQMAQAAWVTMREGEKETVATEIGEVSIRLRHPIQHGTPRVDLCRNGMWVVDDKRIPGFYYSFRDQQPFHAIILIDSETGGELHRLIRKAETPLHDNLSTKLLRPEERKKLRNALNQIRKWLKERVPGTSSEEYSPDDIMTIEVEGSDGPGPGAKKMSFWGAAVEVGKRTRQRPGLGLGPTPNPNPNPEPSPPSPPNPNPDPRPSPVRPSRTPFQFRAIAVQTGSSSCSIRLKCQQNCKDTELCLVVDENSDVTCDRLWSDEHVRLTAVRKAGKLIKLGDEATTARLGSLASGTEYDIDVEYKIPDELVSDVGSPVLRIELLSRSPGTK